MNPLIIGKKKFTNRFFLGTGKFASREQTKAALAASETELVTVALTRVHETETAGDPVKMAEAFKLAVRAAEIAVEARPPAPRSTASATSPMDIFTN